LSVRDVRRHFENLFREVTDTIEETAPAGDENTAAEVIDEWFFIEPAFEELESFAQAQMNNRVQSLALDLFPCKTGIVL
jgi:hypothetical protein